MSTRTHRRTRAQAVLALLVVLSCGVAACAGEEPTPPAPTTPEPVVVTPEVIADKAPVPEPVLPITWPLTGVASEVTDRPAMSIKIENSAAARPQSGLQSADVVWEQMVEGGITRFNVVFHSTIPDLVGPIRSVRPMDAGISAPFGGLMVFSGGQHPFVNAIREAGLQVISHDGGQGGFYRASDRSAPHNVYADPADFLAQASGDHTAPPAQQFAFARLPELATAVVEGTPAASLALAFPSSNPGWTFDSASGTWLRTEGGAPAMAAEGGQLHAVNVVVLRMQVRSTQYRDPGGSPVPETVMTGTGDALVVSGGQSVTGTWSKPDTSSPMTLLAPDGSPILLAPGNTWVELLPTTNSSVSVN